MSVPLVFGFSVTSPCESSLNSCNLSIDRSRFSENIVLQNLSLADVLFVGLMDYSFLMRLAQLGITSAELFQLGVFLEMKTTVREVRRDSGDDVSRAFTLLERWRDSRKPDSNSAELFDQLSGACRDISRADLVEHVRCGESVKPGSYVILLDQYYGHNRDRPVETI